MSNGTAREPVLFYNVKIDICIGVLYCLLGVFGTVSNGVPIYTFWRLRRKLKIVPFLMCALCLAHNDMVRLAFSVIPYGVIFLVGRQAPPGVLCAVIGIIYNFTERFAWFIITSLMVFRCISAMFPIATRSLSPLFFPIALSIQATLLFAVSILPVLPIDMDFVQDRYKYILNAGECTYSLDPNKAQLLTFLVDAVWWGPLITCVVSCTAFAAIMVARSQRFKTLSSKKYDAIKKTVFLTLFFILCYLPMAVISLIFFLMNKGIGISWNDLRDHVGYELFLYLRLVCFYIIPAIRVVFTPLTLKLRAFIRFCSSRKGTHGVKNASKSHMDPATRTLKSRLTMPNLNKSSNKIFTVSSSSVGINILFKKGTLKRTSSEKLV